MKKIVSIILTFVMMLSMITIVQALDFRGEGYNYDLPISVTIEKVYNESNDTLYGIIRAFKEEKIWEHITESVQAGEANTISELAFGDKNVYVSIGRTLYSFDADTGSVIWTVENIDSDLIILDRYENIYTTGIWGPKITVINKYGEIIHQDRDDKYFLIDRFEIVGNFLYACYSSIESDVGGIEKINIKQFRPNEVSVLLNASSLDFDQPPIIVNNRTFVPVRAVVEAMNGDVNWDEVTQCVTLSHNGDTIKLFINSTTAYLNGEPTILDVSPQAINGRTLLPIRFVAENFGYNVEWDEYSKTIDIYSKSENMIDYELLSCIGKTKSSIEDKYGSITNSEYYLGGKYYMHGNMKTQIFYENDDEYYDYEVHDDATENAECLHMFVKLSELITTDKKIYSIADLEKIFGSYKFINQLDSEEYPMCSYEFSFGDYLIYIESDHLNPQVEYAYIFRNLI